MKELEIDEDMFEEDKINRFLNMIATQYDGNLATQYASSYLKKCNELDKYKKVLDKALYWLSENTHYTDFNVDKLVLDENVNLKELLELLEEIK